MKKAWTKVSLGDLLKLERRRVEVVANEEYAEIGVYSFGRGIFHKEPRSGLEVGNKDLYLIQSGDFILQITFAWEGAVALASDKEDGMYGSVRFPTFRVDENRCFPPFLVNYFRTMEGRNQLANISPGSAGRNRVLSLKRIPEVLVTLPPLEEQRHIVARIEALATRVQEALSLREKAVEEAETLVNSVLAVSFREKFASIERISDIVVFANSQVDATIYPQSVYISLADIQSGTGMVIQKQTVEQANIRGTAVSFEPGDVLYSKLRPYLNKVVNANLK